MRSAGILLLRSLVLIARIHLYFYKSSIFIACKQHAKLTRAGSRGFLADLFVISYNFTVFQGRSRSGESHRQPSRLNVIKLTARTAPVYYCSTKSWTHLFRRRQNPLDSAVIFPKHNFACGVNFGLRLFSLRWQNACHAYILVLVCSLTWAFWLRHQPE